MQSHNPFGHNAEPFFLEASPHIAVLMIHGLAATPAHMLPMAHFLHNKGLTVSGVLLSGHAQTTGDLAGKTYADWQRDVRAAYDKLKRMGFSKIVVAGQDLGALLALWLCEECELNGCIVLSTPFKLYDTAMQFSGIAKHFIRERRWKHEPCHPQYDLRYESCPMCAMHELQKLGKVAYTNLGRITNPILAIQSKNDEYIRPSSVWHMFSKTTADRREVLWLNESSHDITIGKERQAANRRVLEFIKTIGEV